MIEEILNGKYRLIRQMGAGGMGAVYEAEEVPSSRRVAVKVISTGDESRDRALVGRFHREAKATMSIDTDHIVRVFDTGNDAASGQPFMVMEYLVGEDLAQCFKRVGPLPPDAALRIVAQACFGLEKAHAARVVHRDIKPANLFLAERPEETGGGLIVKVLDFGIAKIKMDQANITDSKSLTRTGSMVGSPLYMSPEQARGSKSIDHRADVWSMGVVLYQALTGRTPNQDIEALGELIIAICSELPRPVQELAPWVSPEIATIVHRALRFEPAERFQTADEMLAALMALLPDGSSLTAGMLTPLTAEMREHKAALMEAAPATRASFGSGSSARPHVAGAIDPALASTTAAPDFDAPQPRGDMPSTPPRAELSIAPAAARTNEGVATSRPGELAVSSAASAGRGAMLGVLTLLVGGGAAFGAYTLMGQKEAAPVITSAPVTPALPIITAVMTATAMAAPVIAPAGKTVRVAILPLDAAVEVDGVKATAKDGMVEIVGGLGTVHRVHLSKGADQFTDDVAVTQQGAVPAKLELKTTAKKIQQPPQR